jgi:hypothetical protein
MTASLCRALYAEWLASPSSLLCSVSRSMTWNSACTKMTAPSYQPDGGTCSSMERGSLMGMSTTKCTTR